MPGTTPYGNGSYSDDAPPAAAQPSAQGDGGTYGSGAYGASDDASPAAAPPSAQGDGSAYGSGAYGASDGGSTGTSGANLSAFVTPQPPVAFAAAVGGAVSAVAIGAACLSFLTVSASSAQIITAHLRAAARLPPPTTKASAAVSAASLAGAARLPGLAARAEVSRGTSPGAIFASAKLLPPAARALFAQTSAAPARAMVAVRLPLPSARAIVVQSAATASIRVSARLKPPVVQALCSASSARLASALILPKVTTHASALLGARLTGMARLAVPAAQARVLSPFGIIGTAALPRLFARAESATASAAGSAAKLAPLRAQASARQSTTFRVAALLPGFLVRVGSGQGTNVQCAIKLPAVTPVAAAQVPATAAAWIGLQPPSVRAEIAEPSEIYAAQTVRSRAAIYLQAPTAVAEAVSFAHSRAGFTLQGPAVRAISMGLASAGSTAVLPTPRVRAIAEQAAIASASVNLLPPRLSGGAGQNGGAFCAISLPPLVMSAAVQNPATARVWLELSSAFVRAEGAQPSGVSAAEAVKSAAAILLQPTTVAAEALSFAYSRGNLALPGIAVRVRAMGMAKSGSIAVLPTPSAHALVEQAANLSAIVRLPTVLFSGGTGQSSNAFCAIKLPSLTMAAVAGYPATTTAWVNLASCTSRAEGIQRNVSIIAASLPTPHAGASLLQGVSAQAAFVRAAPLVVGRATQSNVAVGALTLDAIMQTRGGLQHSVSAGVSVALPAAHAAAQASGGAKMQGFATLAPLAALSGATHPTTTTVSARLAASGVAAEVYVTAECRASTEPLTLPAAMACAGLQLVVTSGIATRLGAPMSLGRLCTTPAETDPDRTALVPTTAPRRFTKPKGPFDYIDYTMDFSSVLPEDDTLIRVDGAVISSTPGSAMPAGDGSDIRIEGSLASGQAAVIWLSGGIAGWSYTLTASGISQEGRTIRRSVTLTVADL